MAFCVNRNLVTGMPPSVSKAVTNQNDLVTGKVLYFSLWKIRRVIPAKTSLADNPDLKSDNRNNRSFSVDGLRLGITVCGLAMFFVRGFKAQKLNRRTTVHYCTNVE